MSILVGMLHAKETGISSGFWGAPLACVHLLGFTYFFTFLDDEGGASGDDYLKVDSAWHGDIDSDAESVDSEEEDPLK